MTKFKTTSRLGLAAAAAMLVAVGITQDRAMTLDAHQLDNKSIAGDERAGIPQRHRTAKLSPSSVGFGKTKNMYSMVSPALQDPLDLILCEGRVTEGGWGYFFDNPAWQVTFGGSASKDRLGRRAGQEQYVDHNPVDGFDFHSTLVTDVMCFDLPDPVPGKQAVILGQGKVTKLATLQDLIENFMITIDDVAEPGTGRDVYHIELQGAFPYDSGPIVLQGGNVQVR